MISPFIVSHMNDYGRLDAEFRVEQPETQIVVDRVERGTYLNDHATLTARNYPVDALDWQDYFDLVVGRYRCDDILVELVVGLGAS